MEVLLGVFGRYSYLPQYSGENLDHLKEVLDLLKNAGMKIKLKKCFFFVNRIEYLGQVTRPNYLEVAPQETDAIRKLKNTTNVTELR